MKRVKLASFDSYYSYKVVCPTFKDKSLGVDRKNDFRDEYKEE